MMSAKLPSLGLPREEALRYAASEEELPTVSSNRFRSESGRARGEAMERQRKSERRASSKEIKDLLLLPPPSTMAELNLA